MEFCELKQSINEKKFSKLTTVVGKNKNKIIIIIITVENKTKLRK